MTVRLCLAGPHHTDHDGPEPAAMKPAIADTKMNNQRPLAKKEWRTYHLLMRLFYVIGRIPRVVGPKDG
jgi:hypothetical protein